MGVAVLFFCSAPGSASELEAWAASAAWPSVNAAA